MHYTKLKYFTAKLLVTTGDSRPAGAEFSRVIEIIDLSDDPKTCEPLENFPIYTSGGFAILLDDENPVICGGSLYDGKLRREITDRCFVISQTEPQELRLKESREWASTIKVSPSVAWVTGGSHFITGIPIGLPMSSTEYLSLDDSLSGPGPELPIHVWGHCMLQRDESTAILIGGVSTEYYSSARSFIFDFTTDSWIEVDCKKNPF